MLATLEVIYQQLKLMYLRKVIFAPSTGKRKPLETISTRYLDLSGFLQIKLL